MTDREMARRFPILPAAARGPAPCAEEEMAIESLRAWNDRDPIGCQAFLSSEAESMLRMSALWKRANSADQGGLRPTRIPIAVSGARAGGKTATLHAQLDAMRKSAATEFLNHDPATCWWCQRGLKLVECSQEGSHV